MANRCQAVQVWRHAPPVSQPPHTHAPVHRFEDLMVPRFCWLDLRLALSLYSMKGLPVSTCRAVRGSTQVSEMRVRRGQRAGKLAAQRQQPANRTPLYAHAYTIWNL